MSQNGVIENAAAALYEARRTRKPVPPISETFGIKDADGAYAVQDLNTKRWVSEGRRIVGRKIGLTSKAIQAQLGVDQPDYGMLWGENAWTEGEVVPNNVFMQPRVEAEVAFVMKRGLADPNVTMSEVVAAIDYAAPSVELVDSAVADWKITLADTVADNASAGGFMLGLSPRKLENLDLRLCGMVMSKNEQPVSLGVGAACLGHPLIATLWLARKMAQVGRPLEEGDVVLSGALGPMVGAAPGDRFLVEIQGFSPFSLQFAE